uniref:Claudin n=1 Tax=Eptatretus burgeri TaxID=7764 RepID=A0A8C4QVU8_EPTBU
MQLDLTGTLIAILGWIVIASTLADEYWSVSTVAGSVITSVTIYENLWKSCAMDSMGLSNCRDFQSILGLSAYIQACRALVIGAVVLGFFGSIAAVIGMKCTRIGPRARKKKRLVAVSGGALYVLTGISCFTAITWYASRITTDFYNPLYPGMKYEFGSALYIGWAGSLLALGGGAMLCVEWCTDSEDNHRLHESYGRSAGRQCRNARHLKHQSTNKCPSPVKTRTDPFSFSNTNYESGNHNSSHNPRAKHMARSKLWSKQVNHNLVTKHPHSSNSNGFYEDHDQCGSKHNPSTTIANISQPKTRPNHNTSDSPTPKQNPKINHKSSPSQKHNSQNPSLKQNHNHNGCLNRTINHTSQNVSGNRRAGLQEPWTTGVDEHYPRQEVNIMLEAFSDLQRRNKHLLTLI